MSQVHKSYFSLAPADEQIVKKVKQNKTCLKM